MKVALRWYDAADAPSRNSLLLKHLGLSPDSSPKKRARKDWMESGKGAALRSSGYTEAGPYKNIRCCISADFQKIDFGLQILFASRIMHDSVSALIRRYGAHGGQSSR